MKFADSDLQILVENNIDRARFLKLDNEQMSKLNFSQAAREDFVKIIKKERFNKLKKFPTVCESDLHINTTRKGTLGAGSTASVYIANYNNGTYAAKKFHANISETSEFQNEIRATSILAHDHIVRTTHIIVDDDDQEMVLGLLMEKLECNLQTLLKSAPPIRKQLLTWCHHVATAVAHCHAAKVVHSDIKPENILISKHGEAKLTDFGSASVLNTTIRVSKGKVVGTPQFIAPEFRDTGATKATDIFSFGMTLWAVLHPDVDFPLGENEKDIEANLAKGVRPAITASDVSDDLTDLIEKCWHQNPKMRPSSKEATELLSDIIATSEEVPGQVRLQGAEDQFKGEVNAKLDLLLMKQEQSRPAAF
jgi:serine/threonine protein kinase, bacterial